MNFTGDSPAWAEWKEMSDRQKEISVRGITDGFSAVYKTRPKDERIGFDVLDFTLLGKKEKPEAIRLACEVIDEIYSDKEHRMFPISSIILSVVIPRMNKASDEVLDSKMEFLLKHFAVIPEEPASEPSRLRLV